MRRPAVAVLLALLGVLVAAVPAQASDRFIDDDRSVHVRDIEAIAAEGITLGCTASGLHFCPDRPVTRAEMAGFLRRGLDLPASPRDHFADDQGWTLEGDINALAHAHITRGCRSEPQPGYCPDRPVTRGETAAFLRRALGLRVPDVDHFRDDDGHPFEDDIDALAGAGVTRGCRTAPEPAYCPDRTVTRAEMAAFLTRALELSRPHHGQLHHPPDEPFAWSSTPVAGSAVEDRVRGVSWRPGCPVPLEDLRYLRVSHVDQTEAVRTGELIVHHSVVSDVVGALRDLYERGFPITRMRLVSDYRADDDASMAADNTSAFNCRYIAGTTRWSNHAYGTAIDINPIRNPYVRGSDVSPADGRRYTDRSDVRPGMLVSGSPDLAAWTSRGWDWGGTWRSSKDYQHLSAHGG